jgi:hypothetical protein
MQSELCKHKDTRAFGDTLCCFSCGSVLLQPPEQDNSAYKYKSLNRGTNEVRLVILMPGSDLDPLMCHIDIVELDRSRQYDAVSYTWATESGDASTSQSIHVECKGNPQKSKIIKITKNCEAALRQLRHGHEERTIWIDSICIDQSRLQERNHQVGMMDKIYKNATCVQICIHDPTHCYKDAIKLLSTHFVLDFVESLSQDELKSCLAQLAVLFDRRYFNRVWVSYPISQVRLERALTLHRGFYR